MSALESSTILPFLAGLNDEDEPVFEGLEVAIVETTPMIVRILRSPLFTRNYAAGDKLKVINADAAQYELLQRSGNLCIRVFCKGDIDALEQSLTPSIEKLDGTLDLQSEGALVYSIHVSIGFNTIESVLNNACEEHAKSIWYYGNVYDPDDGVTPMQWWQSYE